MQFSQVKADHFINNNKEDCCPLQNANKYYSYISYDKDEENLNPDKSSEVRDTHHNEYGQDSAVDFVANYSELIKILKPGAVWEYGKTFFKELEIWKKLSQSHKMNLYWVDLEEQKLYLKQNSDGVRQCSINIDSMGSVVGAAAYFKKMIYLPERSFANKLKIEYLKAKCLLYFPIVDRFGNCVCVLELYKEDDTKYSQLIIEYLKEAVTWIESVLLRSIERANMDCLKDFSLQNSSITSEYFENKITFPDYLGKFFHIIFNIFGSQIALFYEFDKRGIIRVWRIKQKGNTAEVIQLKTIKRLNNTFVFLKRTFKSKEILNVTLLEDDKRLTNEYLRFLRIRIYEIMCAPVLLRGTVGAIMQIINNKRSGDDVNDMIKDANQYCAVTLQYKKLHDILKNKKAKNEILKSRMEYFVSRPKMEHPELFNFSIEEEEIGEFTFYPIHLESVIPMVIYMIKSACPTIIKEETLRKFVLAVMRCHRIDLPFHNVIQSCDSTNTMYSIIIRNVDFFQDYEILVLLVASFLYCVDHRGYSNFSMELMHHAFTELYTDSYKANNRYHLGQFIINKTGLIAHWPHENQEQFMKLLHDIIFKEKKYNVSTYRDNFFKHILKENQKYILLHRPLVMEFLLWCSYHSRHINKYKHSKKLTAAIYEEYFSNGEILMKYGIRPGPQHRPENKGKILEFEIDYISNTLLPGYKGLMELFPSTSLLYDIAKSLMENYQDAMELNKRKIWNPSISQGMTTFF